MEHLIESVRKYPCLWKIDSENYKNNELKEEAWRIIITECDIMDVKEAKSMWKKLRDGHRQALNKKKTTTGQAASSDRLWKYEKQMDFLLPHLANRQRGTNATATQSIIQTDDESVENTQTEQSSELMSTTNNESQQTTYNTSRTKRKSDKITEYFQQEQKRRDQRSQERDVFRKELLSREQNVKPIKEDSALKKIFDSMCDITEDLPEYLQIKVQRQVFNAVIEAREAKLQKQSETPNPVFPSQTQYRSYVPPPCSSDSCASGFANYEVHSPSTLPSTLPSPSSPNVQYCDVFSPRTNANEHEGLRGYLTSHATYTDM